MRQNTEGNQIILMFSRLENNVHPLQNAEYKCLITLSSKKGKTLCINYRSISEMTTHVNTEVQNRAFLLPQMGFQIFSLFLWEPDPCIVFPSSIVKTKTSGIPKRHSMFVY